MGTREQLISAWEAHDQACLKVSKSRRRPTAWTLALETEALIEANDDFAAEIGMSGLELSRLRSQYRREGLTYSQALAACKEIAQQRPPQ